LEYLENGAQLTRADLIFSRNGFGANSAWFPAPATIIRDPKSKTGRVVAQIPDQATHAVFNLIDENNFMLSHPEMSRGQVPGSAFVLKP
jgi:hypothetical protein